MPCVARLHVRRLDLFGSAVRPDFDDQRSDLDFVVAFDELPPVEYADAFFALKDGLESCSVGQWIWWSNRQSATRTSRRESSKSGSPSMPG